MNARMLIPSKYFSCSDFDGEMTITIDRVDFTDLEVEGKNGKAATTERRGALILREFPGKPWVCNVTNTKCLIAMFGEVDAEKNWPGKRVTVYPERVMSFGEWVLGVRVKGSPDLSQPVNVSLKLRKKKAQVLTMQPTGAAPAKPSPPKPKPSTPYEEMWKDFRAAGGTNADDFKMLVREAFNGKTKDFTPDDVLAFSHVLASRNAAPVESEPPPF
jgi:hypothetical protein